MKKLFLFILFVSCFFIFGCGNNGRTINWVKVDDAYCKTLLDWVIANHPDQTSPLDTTYYDFDVFYSKNYDTCISTFTQYSKKNWLRKSLWYYVLDELGDRNYCAILWVDWYQDWLVTCFWKFEEIIKDGYKLSFNNEWEITNLYNEVLQRLK